MHLNRAATLARLRAAQPFATDVLILGGGINGAGLLRELALNGIDALLVDQADFAAGATSASSRMIHGGLRYLENGDWPASNNPCENSIRPFVVARKGFLFADTVAGAHASANLYSLVETCKANGIDPYRYLTWLFERLPLAKTVDDYDALMPWKMPLSLR